jgi:hypothetical protein
MLDQTGGTQQLISRQRDERSGNLAMAAITFETAQRDPLRSHLAGDGPTPHKASERQWL